MIAALGPSAAAPAALVRPALPAPASRVTRLDRVLLATARGLHRVVARRLARRSATADVVRAQVAASDARALALALGATGLHGR